MAKKQIVAIDIGTNATKLVQLEQTASGIRLVTAGVEVYPRENATEEIGAETIVHTLGHLWKQVHGRKAPTALSIPRPQVTSRRLTNLPAAATEEQLSNLVAIQAETELPFRVENAVYDYHDVRKSENTLSVELIGAKRETVQQQLDYLKSLDIVPQSVMPSALATSVLVGMVNRGENASDGLIMAVDIGAGRTDLCLMAGNALRFSRGFPIGGNHLTQIYQNETDGGFEVAESRKIAHAALNREGNDTPVYEWADRLVSELRRSISAAKRELHTDEDLFIREIWLCGGSSRIAGLADYLTEQLQIQTRLWNPLNAFKTVCGEPPSETPSVDDFGDTFAVALGLGINALTDRISLDLLPKEEKAKLTQAEQRKRMLTAVAAGLILVVGLGLGGLTWSKAHHAKIDALDEQIRNLRPAEANAQKVLIEDLAVANLLTPRISPLDVLRELSLRFADRTKIAWTTFNISRLDEPQKTKITFSIESISHQDISRLISTMGQSGLFRDLKSGQITSVERDKKPIFQAQITCNLTPDALRLFAQTRSSAASQQPSIEPKPGEMPQGNEPPISDDQQSPEERPEESMEEEQPGATITPAESHDSGESGIIVWDEGTDQAVQGRLPDKAVDGSNKRTEKRLSDETAIQMKKLAPQDQAAIRMKKEAPQGDVKIKTVDK